MISGVLIGSLITGIIGVLGVVVGAWLNAKFNFFTNKNITVYRERKKMNEKISEFLRDIATDYANLPYTPSHERFSRIIISYWRFLHKYGIKYNYLSKKVYREFIKIDEDINFNLLPLMLSFDSKKGFDTQKLSKLYDVFAKRRDYIDKLIKKEVAN